VAAPTGTPTPAASLNALGIAVSAEDLFTALSEHWAEYRGVWHDGRGFADIRKAWLDCAAGLGQPVAISSGSAVIEGTFDTIDEQGCMVVRTTEGRLVPITAGDVYFGSAATVRAG
jgi:BirA family biotin operon repressor/biotin-[acetyl-CoA-carboxylase] ligase